MFKRCVGPQHAQRLTTMDKDSYPLLLVLMRSRGSLELVSVIEGNSTTHEVLLNLIQSYEHFEQQRQRDAEEEIVREKREDLKQQQEAEYHRSLQADLAKEKARLDDERRQKEEQISKDRLEQQRLVCSYQSFFSETISHFHFSKNNAIQSHDFQKNQLILNQILHD